MNTLFSEALITRFSLFVLERLSSTSQKVLERRSLGPINIVDDYRYLTIDFTSEF